MTGKWSVVGGIQGAATITGRIANTRSEMAIIAAVVRTEWTVKLADVEDAGLIRIAAANRSRKMNKSAEAVRAGMRDAALDILGARGIGGEF